MTDMEREIKRALEVRSLDVDVPADLSARTLEAVRGAGGPSLRDRIRGWRDARRIHKRLVGLPRSVYVGAAAAMAVAMFALGSFVTRGPTHTNGTEALRETEAGGDDSAPGQVVGVVSGGRSSRAGPVADVDQAESGTGGTTSISPPIASRVGTFPPKIVRTANIEIETKRGGFQRAWDKALGIATHYRGFVTNSSTEQLEGKLGRGTITMRVPAEKLDAALKDLRSLGTLKNMNSTGEDVSAQIVDIDARLRALRAEEAALLDLLGRASGVSQVLEVRTQLSAIRQEIESLDAQKKSLDDQVDYSTITATIFEPDAEPEDPDGGIILDAWRTGVGAGLKVVGGTIVVLAVLVPLTLLVLLGWSLVRLALRRRD